MYAALAKDGVTDEELDVAKKQMANTLDEQMREPSFWLARLSQMDFRAANLDDVVNAPAAYQAFTKEQIQTIWAKYYSPAHSVVVTVQPETDAPAAPEPADGPVSLLRRLPPSPGGKPRLMRTAQVRERCLRM